MCDDCAHLSRSIAIQLTPLSLLHLIRLIPLDLILLLLVLRGRDVFQHVFVQHYHLVWVVRVVQWSAVEAVVLQKR